ERHDFGHGKTGEKTKILGPQALPGDQTCHAAQILEAVSTVHTNVLSHAVVMIAPHGKVGMVAHPVDAGGRLEGVIDQVAQTDAAVVRLADRLQGWPICVNISYQQNAHEISPASKN